jgi:choline kinase
MKAVILAAGFGSRLGHGIPKALVEILPGLTVMDIQISALAGHVQHRDIHVVVGYKKEMIMARFPGLTFVENADYAVTNTGRSLLAGLRQTSGFDTIWMNGDIFLTPEVVDTVAACPGNCMAVINTSVAEEEIKYTLDREGAINQVSKTVRNALGEAVGVNKVMAGSTMPFCDALAASGDRDYFEAGIERLVGLVPFFPVDISNLPCVEVDFEDDLRRARMLAHANAATAAIVPPARLA